MGGSFKGTRRLSTKLLYSTQKQHWLCRGSSGAVKCPQKPYGPNHHIWFCIVFFQNIFYPPPATNLRLCYYERLKGGRGKWNNKIKSGTRVFTDGKYVRFVNEVLFFFLMLYHLKSDNSSTVIRRSQRGRETDASRFESRHRGTVNQNQLSYSFIT